MRPKEKVTLTIYPLGCLLWFILIGLVVVLLNWLASR